MDKVWLKHYPSGVPEEIDSSIYGSIPEFFRVCVDKYRDRPAYVNLGKTLSYDETDLLTQQFASYLANVVGMKKGERFAIMMPNLLQYPVAMFGALRAGLAVVNINPLYTDRELQSQLKNSGCTTIIVLENFAHTLSDVIQNTNVSTVITTQVADLVSFPQSSVINSMVKHVKRMVPAFDLPDAVKFKEALKLGAKHDFKDVKSTHEDIAFLQYTGGTTGIPKGAILTHKNMISNMLQAEVWTSSELEPGKETIITALPLNHIFALTANAMFALALGACNVLITNPRDFPRFVKVLGRYPFSFMTGVNTLFNALLNTPGFEKIDFSKFKVALGGGMAVQCSVADRWKEVTGVTLVEAYGLTEASPAVCMNPMDLQEYNGMIGLPLPSTDISIRDENGIELGLHEAGELWVKGPQVMAGYWQNPEETANVLTEDGWLRTGDVAEVNDEGFVKIVDRIKDAILVSGFNVYPNEVEDVVSAYEKVQEVGATGVPDEKSGEVVKICVVKKDESLTEQELQTYCHQQLSGYKCPRHIVFVGELPKTHVGKILRRELVNL